jgi:hypothetical protein
MPVVDSSQAVVRMNITTSPPGAAVSVDRIAHGASPVVVTLPAGANVELAATKNGYGDAKMKVVAEHDNETVILTLSLSPTATSSSRSADAGSAQIPTPHTKSKSVDPPPKTLQKPKPAFDPNDVGGE